MITFWSRSKNPAHRYLSNFQLLPRGLRIPSDFFISYVTGYTFPTVENAFQACKYAYSDNPLGIQELTCCSPREAKSMGSMGGMKKRGTTLDVETWNNVSFECMNELIKLRFEQDSQFRETILHTEDDFYHIETRPPYIWGGCMKYGKWIGQNRLGNILNRLKKET